MFLAVIQNAFAGISVNHSSPQGQHQVSSQSDVVPATAKTHGAKDASVLYQVNGAPAARRLKIIGAVTQIPVFRYLCHRHRLLRLRNHRGSIVFTAFAIFCFKFTPFYF